MSSHAVCEKEGRHVCQRPSGQMCAEPGCEEEAGTLWGPHWCPMHDKERLDRVSASLDQVRRDFDKRIKEARKMRDE